MRCRILLGVIAFPISFALALVAILTYNILFHTPAVFAESAFWGNLTYMRMTYSLGADVNAPGCRYRSCYPPLIVAALSGESAAVQFLLERGADVNAKTNGGTTALMCAAMHGDVELVRLLISHGADVNADRDVEADDPDDTALKLAKFRGHTRVVEILRQAGAVDAP